jgi:hypothetical protein
MKQTFVEKTEMAIGAPNDASLLMHRQRSVGRNQINSSLPAVGQPSLRNSSWAAHYVCRGQTFQIRYRNSSRAAGRAPIERGLERYFQSVSPEKGR